MIYKRLKDIPYVDILFFIKSFEQFKRKSYYTKSDIREIEGYVKKETTNIYNKPVIHFSLNFFSKKHNQIVQSDNLIITKKEYDRSKMRILNKKLKKLKKN